MQLVQGMSIKDCQEGDQRATEVDNEDTSMNHMPHLWKSDVLDADISRRTTKLTEKGCSIDWSCWGREEVNFMGSC